MVDFFIRKKYFIFCIIFSLLLVFNSCAVRTGVMHTVEEGQTLWQLARVYDVDLEVLIRVNRIRDARQLRPGTNLVISGVSEAQDIPARRVATRPPATSGENSKTSEPQTSREPDRAERSDNNQGSTTADIRFNPIWPVEGRLVSRFEAGGDVTRRGIRIEAPAGSEVNAADAGIVKMAGVWESVPQLGNIVIILHSGDFATVYAHLDSLDVSEGDRVSRGEKIGMIGQTGYVDKNLCYFEIRYKLKPRDPLLFLGDPL